LAFIEKIIKSNIYLYILLKYLYQNHLYFFFYEKEFEILSKFKIQFIKKYFCILDIGSNNGVSALSIRLFNKKNKIYSFEPNFLLKNKLNKVKKKISNFKFYLIGALDKKKKKTFFIPFFKNHCLDSCASINAEYVRDSVSRGFFNNKVLENITIKKIICKFINIDSLNKKPFFIKMDTEGSEQLVIKGLQQTIYKYKPVLMIEKSDLNFKKIKKILLNLKYDIFQYKNKFLIKYKLQKNIHTNLICVHKEKHNIFLDGLFK
jgi:FkbM family methyltransferase